MVHVALPLAQWKRDSKQVHEARISLTLPDVAFRNSIACDAAHFIAPTEQLVSLREHHSCVAQGM